MRFRMQLRACGVIPIYEAIYFNGIFCNNVLSPSSSFTYRSSGVYLSKLNSRTVFLAKAYSNVTLIILFILSDVLYKYARLCLFNRQTTDLHNACTLKTGGSLSFREGQAFVNSPEKQKPKVTSLSFSISDSQLRKIPESIN